VSGDTKKEIRRQWQTVPFDTLRLDTATRLIESEMMRKGYLASRINTEASASASVRRVVFKVESGIRYGRTQTVFDGA
jgi:hypothetical protein